MFKEILKLDISDLNWDISSEKINQVELTSSGKYGLLEGIARLAYHLFKSLFYLKFSIVQWRSKVVLFSGTKNQSLALEKLKLDSPKSHIKFGNQTDKVKNNSYEFYPYFISLLFIPIFLYKYFAEKSVFKKRMMLCRLDRYLFSYGLCFFFYIVLDKRYTNLVIVSNDHSVWQRALIFIAKMKGIKTAYVQHANVSPLFPKLSFDYAFLDGNYAKKTYAVNGCKVYMVGCLRFEDIIQNKKSKIKGIKLLVCFNKIDSKEKISKCIDFFIKSKVSFDVRLHPMETRADIIKIVSSSKFYNDVSSVNISDVLLNYTHCFSGTSSVFLEASLCGLRCFSVDEIYDDYYGFQKDGIVNVLSNLADIKFEDIKPTQETSSFLYHYSESSLVYLNAPSNRIKYILEKDGVI